MDHNPHPVTIASTSHAGDMFKSIGSTAPGSRIMSHKAVTRAVKVEDLDPRQANILKQEMLAAGGDAATARHVIDDPERPSDAVILGTDKQYAYLCHKLRMQPFGLPKLAGELEKLLANLEKPAARTLDCNGRRLEVGKRTLVMGILNVTPDSFSDGGEHPDGDSAVEHAIKMVKEGADIIDIGGESTRPGAEPVPLEAELERVIPIVQAVSGTVDVPISIDTTKAEVARRALEMGAGIINDISALRFDPDMAGVAAEHGVPVVLMHMLGEPGTMQEDPEYKDVVGDIYRFFRERIAYAATMGIEEDRIILDPGIGFGKTLDHNLELIRRLGDFRGLGLPLLSGPSRKSFIGKVLDLPVEERVEGTLAAVVLSIANGADIVRVHDVREAVRAARMADAIVCGG